MKVRCKGVAARRFHLAGNVIRDQGDFLCASGHRWIAPASFFHRFAESWRRLLPVGQFGIDVDGATLLEEQRQF
jgi:hypothetical protein